MSGASSGTGDTRTPGHWLCCWQGCGCHWLCRWLWVQKKKSRTRFFLLYCAHAFGAQKSLQPRAPAQCWLQRTEVVAQGTSLLCCGDFSLCSKLCDVLGPCFPGAAAQAGGTFPRASPWGGHGRGGSESGFVPAARLLGLETEILEYNIATCLPHANIQQEKSRQDAPRKDNPIGMRPHQDASPSG